MLLLILIHSLCYSSHALLFDLQSASLPIVDHHRRRLAATKPRDCTRRFDVSVRSSCTPVCTSTRPLLLTTWISQVQSPGGLTLALLTTAATATTTSIRRHYFPLDAVYSLATRPHHLCQKFKTVARALEISNKFTRCR